MIRGAKPMPIYEDMEMQHAPPMVSLPKPLEMRSRLLTHPIMSARLAQDSPRHYDEACYYSSDPNDAETSSLPSADDYKRELKKRLLLLDTLFSLSRLHLVIMIILLVVGWMIGMTLTMILIL